MNYSFIRHRFDESEKVRKLESEWNDWNDWNWKDWDSLQSRCELWNMKCEILDEMKAHFGCHRNIATCFILSRTIIMQHLPFLFSGELSPISHQWSIIDDKRVNDLVIPQAYRDLVRHSNLTFIIISNSSFDIHSHCSHYVHKFVKSCHFVFTIKICLHFIKKEGGMQE
jgi:hypothetical protein